MDEQLNVLSEESEMLLNYASSLKCVLNAKFNVYDINEELDNLREDLTERILRLQKITEVHQKIKQFQMIGKVMNSISLSFGLIADNSVAMRHEIEKKVEKHPQKVLLKQLKNEQSSSVAGTTAAAVTASALPTIAHFTKFESSSVPNYLGRYTEKNLNDFVDMLNSFWLRKHAKIVAKKGVRAKDNSGRAFLSELDLCEFMNKPQLDKKTINLLAVLKKFNKIVESKDKDLKKYYFGSL